ncbi:HetP family heterocyst commitment protein [Nodularia sphaerocarpa]|uniref:HetP family heterocyst commitment protein n=1 Tax=Nodularia sphaerocarpa TaxID=137816 RepID=UPI001EFAD54F|nr:HetP family heterocyst commitment protein [Nodularia sphaerocarpa]MDB9372468.1 HetP family heterocyst commitment protein [Nodularia sphaerocarpa CS-585]MDB9378252.1 HetP family heterocyst commitment protein [Nodularia sphaerocarpa CS-585A2]ULP72323.1 hypothetical protein BDGGKGIB_01962 [Nodularia sphaerocarpa UHCC 0038]
MNEEISDINQAAENIIDGEGWGDIIKAIILGKYYWACVLFIHLMGYNPTKYIPPETYLQLLQNNFISPISSEK